MTDMERISAVRSAATWLRKTSRTIDEYPKRDRLDSQMRSQALLFACGRLPWPARWTKRLFEAATAG